MKKHLSLLTALAVALLPLAAHADQSFSAASADKLREMVKAQAKELEDVKGQLDTVQATADQAQKDKDAVQGQLDALTKQAHADKETADNLIATLKAQLAEAQRLVALRERQNFELFTSANEILTRYEKFGLGDAIGAKEPFTGNMKVKLENLVQDYQDKLIASRAKPTDKAPAATSTTVQASAPPSPAKASDAAPAPKAPEVKTADAATK